MQASIGGINGAFCVNRMYKHGTGMYFIIMPILYRHVSHKGLLAIHKAEFLEVLHRPTANKRVVLCADRQSMKVYL